MFDLGQQIQTDSVPATCSQSSKCLREAVLCLGACTCSLESSRVLLSVVDVSQEEMGSWGAFVGGKLTDAGEG